MLILPAKAADAHGSRCFEHRDFNRLALNHSVAFFWLLSGNVEQSLIIDRFDESVTQRVQHSAQSADVLGGRQMLLGLRTDRTIIDDGTAGNRVLAVVDENGGIDEIAHIIEVPGAHLGDLAYSARDRVLMAIDAGGCVVDRTEAGVDAFTLFVVRLVEGKRVICRFGQAIANALRTGLVSERRS